MEIKGKLEHVNDSGITVEPKLLSFQLDDELVSQIEEAKASHQKRISNLRVIANTYEEYGKDLLKKYRYHPEAFMQVKILLRLHKMQTFHVTIAAGCNSMRVREVARKTCSNLRNSCNAKVFCWPHRDLPRLHAGDCQVCQCAIRRHC